MAQPEMCITCKKIIEDVQQENLTTPEGHRICLACDNPCALDKQGIVYHHQCPDACHVVETWENYYKLTNNIFKVFI